MSRHLSDWIEHYLQFTQNSESPTLYHVWTGLTAISSALRRKCYCNWGLRGYIYPNLYVALVGPPGGRKGTAMKIAKSMLQKLELPIGSDALGSTQRLYQEIIGAEASYIEHNGLPRGHKSLSVWSEEFQVFLSDKDPMLIASLTDLFDCANSWKYSTLSRGVEDISNCWLTIIGAITPSLLQSRLSQDAVGGGLLSRIIFVVGYGPIKKIPLPFLTPQEEKKKQQLEEDLQQISNLSGAFFLEKDFLSAYSKWYRGSSSADGIDNAQFLGYNSRRALHLNKLCMLLSASENDEMIISKTHFEKALAVLEETEVDMPNAFPGFGLAKDSDTYAKVVDFIESNRDFTFDDILSSLEFDTSKMELEEYLMKAESAGRLKVTHSPTMSKYTSTYIPKKSKGKSFLKSTLYKRMI